MAAVNSDNVAQQERHSEWYGPQIVEAPPPIRQLLESYSHVPSEKVVDHINKIVRTFLTSYTLFKHDEAYSTH